MGKALFYSEIPIKGIDSSIRAFFDVHTLGSRSEMARALVEQSQIQCLVVAVSEVDSELRKLLSSIEKCYPVLLVCLVTPERLSPLPPTHKWIDSRLDASEIAGQAHKWVARLPVKDRRERPRFDWPLKGQLSFDGKKWSRHSLWALSSGGCFLEHRGPPPSTGLQAHLHISFQNSRLMTQCEVLDPRHSSSKLPAGFAVRFVSLSEASRTLINRIVQDALLQKLLEADTEPEIPSLDEDDFSIPGIESL